MKGREEKEEMKVMEERGKRSRNTPLNKIV